MVFLKKLGKIIFFFGYILIKIKKKNFIVKCFFEFLKDIKRVNIYFLVLCIYFRIVLLLLLLWGML